MEQKLIEEMIDLAIAQLKFCFCGFCGFFLGGGVFWGFG